MPAYPPQVGDDLVWAEAFTPARRGPALFLDRDGVVVEEVHFLHRPDDVRLLPGAVDTIRAANARRVHVVLVTNQSGIARGLFGWDAFAAVQRRLVELLGRAGARVDAVVASPYHADGRPPYDVAEHPSRKPRPGMLLKAAGLLDIELNRSWIAGDRDVDVEAGRKAGLAGALHLATGYGREHRARALALARPGYPVLAAPDLTAAPGLIPLLR